MQLNSEFPILFSEFFILYLPPIFSKCAPVPALHLLQFLFHGFSLSRSTSAIKTGFNRFSCIGNCISKQCRISIWYLIFQAFSGRIYATGNPQACFELGNGASEMTLRIPIGTQCGTVQSGRGRYVNHVVIQANPVIMQVEIGIDCCKETVQSSQYHNMVKPH